LGHVAVLHPSKLRGGERGTQTAANAAQDARGWHGREIDDDDLRSAIATASSARPRRGEVVLRIGGAVRTGLISFRVSQCHIHYDRLMRVIIQQAGPRPYVRVQGRVEALLDSCPNSGARRYRLGSSVIGVSASSNGNSDSTAPRLREAGGLCGQRESRALPRSAPSGSNPSCGAGNGCRLPACA
jgi:hypothetical protein